MSLEVTDDVSTEIDTSTPAPAEILEATPASDNSQVGAQAATAQVASTEAALPGTATPAAPAYVPNFKYSVRGQDKEISEKYHSLIKDAESEKEIRELHEKAEGLEFVKNDRAQTKAEFEGWKSQAMPYLQVYSDFTRLRDGGNIDAALQVAGITDEMLFEVALRKLELEKNPVQAKLYKDHTNQSLRQIQIENENFSYKQSEQQKALTQFSTDLDNTLMSHRDIVSQVEAKLGSPGSFREEVIALGDREFSRGRNLSIQDAVEQVVNKYKPFLQAPAQVIPQVQPVTHQSRPATIPNTGSPSTSVVKQLPKSLADLKLLAKEAV